MYIKNFNVLPSFRDEVQQRKAVTKNNSLTGLRRQHSPTAVLRHRQEDPVEVGNME